MNLGQKLDEPWPLSLMDHSGNSHHVNLNPGEMLFFESSKTTHGRLNPLKGEFYDTFYISFK